MTTLTIESLIEMGGSVWEKGDMTRVYITQETFNKITGFGVCLNVKKWKFYADVSTGDIFRTCGKKPVLEINISKLEAA